MSAVQTLSPLPLEAFAPRMGESGRRAGMDIEQSAEALTEDSLRTVQPNAAELTDDQAKVVAEVKRHLGPQQKEMSCGKDAVAAVVAKTTVPIENAILLRFVDWKPSSLRGGLGDQSQKP